jgi:hypothetical protein
MSILLLQETFLGTKAATIDGHSAAASTADFRTVSVNVKEVFALWMLRTYDSWGVIGQI